MIDKSCTFPLQKSQSNKTIFTTAHCPHVHDHHIIIVYFFDNACSNKLLENA